MTNEAIITEASWGSHRVRLIEIGGIQYVPVTDIAKAVGVRKRALLTLLDRNPDVFAQHEQDAHLSTPTGSQRTRCINLIGAYGMLTKVSTNHIKNGEVKANLIAFNKKVMAKVVGSPEPFLALPPAKTEPDYDGILAKVQFVNKLADLTGWNRLELQKEVLRDAGMQHLTWHIEPEQKPALPAPKPKVKDYMTATEIGELCGMSAQQINKFLYNNHYIIKDDAYDWRMTELGREFGEERVLEPQTGILVITCFWKPSILEKMNIQQKAMI